MPWEVISRETVYDGLFKVFKDRLRRPDGGENDYTWIPSQGAAAVLAFDRQGRIVLTRQYRHPLGQTILDLPAGGIHEGESAEDAARRELKGETGYTAGRLERLGSFYPSPGRQATVVHLFLAEEIDPGESEPDDVEVIEVVHMPWPDLLRLVASAEAVDSALAYAVLMWMLRSQP